MIWSPKPLWAGADAYIIGGGSSLSDFDWSLLKGKMTIGINSAYILGPKIVSIVIFCDMQFFGEHSRGLEAYGNPVFTNCSELYHSPVPFLYTMRRAEEGLHHDMLAFSGNTGIAAINLALILGAKRVLLLGYDMFAESKKKWNWHHNQNEINHQELFIKFQNGFREIIPDWKKKFPHQEIINVSDVSRLEGFPKIGLKEWFSNAD